MDELEALVDIWKRGDNSSLAGAAGTSTAASSSSQPSGHSVTPTPNDSLAIAKAVENLFRKQKAVEQQSTIIAAPHKGRGRPPKSSKMLTSIGGPSAVSVIQSPGQPMVLKQALGAQGATYVSGQGLVTLPSSSMATSIAALPKDMVLADAGNGQLQLINSSSIITGQKTVDTVGYVIQSMPGISAGGQTFLHSPAVAIAPTNFVPIAPKAPTGDSTVTAFQPIPPPPPKPVRPPMPVCKPKVVKPRGRQPKLKSPITESLLAAVGEAPTLTPYEDTEGQPKPWTSMIMEGDTCPYFLFIEDANYYYSAEEDAWLPADQQTMAVDT